MLWEAFPRAWLWGSVARVRFSHVCWEWQGKEGDSPRGQRRGKLPPRVGVSSRGCLRALPWYKWRRVSEPSPAFPSARRPRARGRRQRHVAARVTAAAAAAREAAAGGAAAKTARAARRARPKPLRPDPRTSRTQFLFLQPLAAPGRKARPLMNCFPLRNKHLNEWNWPRCTSLNQEYLETSYAAF